MRFWLKAEREKIGLSQSKLGQKLGMSQNYYSQIELGQRQETLNLTTAAALAEIFGLSLEQVLKFETERTGA